MSGDGDAETRGLSCAAVAIIIAERRRLPRVPHASTLRRWIVQWGEEGKHYTATPGRFWILPAGIEKITVHLAQPK